MADSCICVNGPETTCPTHGRRTRGGRPPTPPRLPRLGDSPLPGLPADALEAQRDQAMVAALFYWQLADRRKNPKADYEAKAALWAARALDREEQLDRLAGKRKRGGFG